MKWQFIWCEWTEKEHRPNVQGLFQRLAQMHQKRSRENKAVCRYEVSWIGRLEHSHWDITKDFDLNTFRILERVEYSKESWDVSFHLTDEMGSIILKWLRICLHIWLMRWQTIIVSRASWGSFWDRILLTMTQVLSRVRNRNGNIVKLKREGERKHSKIWACANKNGFSLIIE